MSRYFNLKEWNDEICIAPLLKDGSDPASVPTIRMKSLQTLGQHDALLKAGQAASNHLNFRAEFPHIAAGEPTDWVLWMVKLSVERLVLRFIHRADLGNPVRINVLGTSCEVVVVVESPITLEVQFERPKLLDSPATTYGFAMNSSGAGGTHNIRYTEQQSGQANCDVLNLSIAPST